MLYYVCPFAETFLLINSKYVCMGYLYTNLALSVLV